jgi:hypothetical protein
MVAGRPWQVGRCGAACAGPVVHAIGASAATTAAPAEIALTRSTLGDYRDRMAELVRTNDLALISAVEGLLQEAEIPCHVADRHSSVLEGTLNFLKMRILVPDDREAEARELLTDADLGEWLRQ